MNTYKFPKHPNAGSNSPWRLSKHVIETEQTLPTNAPYIRGTFNGVPATIMQVSKKVVGDTDFNSRYETIGLTVETNNELRGAGHFIHETFLPDNIHLLFDNENGFHAGCTATCHCQTMEDQEYYRHKGIFGGCQDCDSRF